MGFFNKIDNSTIVDTLEQIWKKRHHEIFFTDTMEAGTFYFY